jgi:hypothetical protein
MKKLLVVLAAVLALESSALACFVNENGTITRCQDNTCTIYPYLELLIRNGVMEGLENAVQGAPQAAEKASEPEKSVKYNECDGCHKVFESTQLKICGACRDVRYCSSECQKVDWKRFHKQNCNPRVRINKNPSLRFDFLDSEAAQGLRQASGIDSAQVIGFSSAPNHRPVLSQEHQCFLLRLKGLSLDSILDRAEGEAACKAIGQEAFDYFKDRKKGDSRSAFRDIQAIVNEIHFSGGDGPLRKQYIERAFDGVGDETKSWIP